MLMWLNNLLVRLRKQQIERMSFVHDGSEVRISNSWTTLAFQDICFAQYGEIGAYTYPLPDEVDSVIKIELKEEIWWYNEWAKEGLHVRTLIF